MKKVYMLAIAITIGLASCGGAAEQKGNNEAENAGTEQGHDHGAEGHDHDHGAEGHDHDASHAEEVTMDSTATEAADSTMTSDSTAAEAATEAATETEAAH